MYLVFASKTLAPQIIDKFASEGNKATHIPSMQIEVAQQAIAELQNIVNNFDYIIFTSPTAIEYAGSVIKDVNAEFITVGKMTAQRLAKHIRPNNKILYPVHSSGVDALIKEVLDSISLANKRVLLVKGDSDSLQLTEYIANKVEVYQELTIYHYNYLPLDLKLLLKTATGIVITSSVEVNYLFSQAKKFGYLEDLLLLPFVTIHQNIIRLLQANGVSNIVLKQILLPNTNLN